jgi:hypothetical protein
MALNHGSEWTSALHRPIHRLRIARVVSQLGIGAPRAATALCKLHGPGAVPTFFWGGKAVTAAPALSVSRLNHMGVWRDTHRSQ